jgi:hypothetical protein
LLTYYKGWRPSAINKQQTKQNKTKHMAIKKQTDTVIQLNSKTPIPQDRYVCRCTKESFGPSRNSGNLMITREWEIVSPEEVTIGDQKVQVAGQKLYQYLVTKNLEDAAKSDKSLGRVFDDYNALGFPTADGIDDENPTLMAEGKYADIIIGAEESVARKDPTPEQRAKRQLGDPIKDGNGKDIKTYRPVIKQIIGQASV